MLKAKLQATVMNQRIISGEKLQNKFRRVRECHLTLVTAPAGSGKTTAVRECWVNATCLGLGCPWTITAFMNDKKLSKQEAEDLKKLIDSYKAEE